MYLPPHFAETDFPALAKLITQNPLGALVTHNEQGLDANHLPFELIPPSTEHPQGVLRAHIARANPLWQDIAQGAKVMVIFRASDAYISPNWYPSKHETHQQVPTWNYQVVHVHGTINFQDDEKTVRGIVARLTREHELRSVQPKPWKMSDSAPEFIDGLLQKIIGLDIAIHTIVGKSKLSQNKSLEDRTGAAEALQTRNPAMARAMLGTLGK